MADVSRRYKKRDHLMVTAVQLNVETEGFDYQKWGGRQRCRAKDWLVQNLDDVYTVDHQTFSRTYEQVSAGQYRKVVAVTAHRALKAGKVETLSGTTAYKQGDYLVQNVDGQDTYAVPGEMFERMYEPVT
jgi:hypothetical protein